MHPLTIPRTPELVRMSASVALGSGVVPCCLRLRGRKAGESGVQDLRCFTPGVVALAPLPVGLSLLLQRSLQLCGEQSFG